eukprot:COSAG01_NODE_18170_length_1095_cov_15.995984_2_plen_198_part_00
MHGRVVGWQRRLGASADPGVLALWHAQSGNCARPDLVAAATEEAAAVTSLRAKINEPPHKLSAGGNLDSSCHQVCRGQITNSCSSSSLGSADDDDEVTERSMEQAMEEDMEAELEAMERAEAEAAIAMAEADAEAAIAMAEVEEAEAIQRAMCSAREFAEAESQEEQESDELHDELYTSEDEVSLGAYSIGSGESEY